MLEGGQLREARKLLEEISTQRRGDPQVLNLLGLTYFKLNLLQAARRIYQHLIGRFPKAVSLRVNLGLVLLRQGQLDLSRESLQAAISLAPEHRRAHCYLGLVHFRRGDLGLAREHFLRGGAADFAARVERRFAEGSSILPAPEPAEDSRFQQVTGSVELDAAGQAAAEIVPKGDVAHATPGGIESLAQDGPTGFVAGPGARARLRVDGSGKAFVRREDVVAALAGGASFGPGQGPFVGALPSSLLLLSTPSRAFSLQGLRDARIRAKALRGFVGELRLEPSPRPGPFVILRGSGDVLLDAPAEPLMLELEAEETLSVMDTAVLACAPGVLGGPQPSGMRICTGPGWIVVAPWRGRE
ncbi:MAG: tetratricopeptide repeat protein [Myxococcota bacterium]